jgi:hypothetical protein
MCVVGGAKKQLGDPTAKRVEIREVESVHRSKFKRLFGFGHLFSGLGNGSAILLVTFFTDPPPHEAGIVEVFEDAKIAPDARPSKFNSVIGQKRESLGFEK